MEKKEPTSNFQIFSALQLWQKETSLPSIPTFSHKLDETLGTDGIQLGSITEVIGPPGSGKTQLCLQLCATVQIPTELGGLCSDALFINTNGNFTIKRFKEILKASQKKCKELSGEVFHERDLLTGLEKLHYIDAFELDECLHTLKSIPKLLIHHPSIKLVIIDSIIFPYKEQSSDKERTAQLFRNMAGLQAAALQMQVAIVLTNEMTTRLGIAGDQVVGALGDAWAHRSNVRVLLTQDGNERLAAVIKSNVAAETVCRFKITQDGIRDV